MKIVIAVCVLWLGAVAAGRAEASEKALCVVCAASGETEPEKVGATREYKGTTYYFCSTKCADTFDANPAAYVLETGTAPASTWTTTTGASLTLESMRGQVVLLDFWATWCKPCVESMPELDAIFHDYQKQGLMVVGVSVDRGDDRQKKVKKFLAKKPVGYPIAIDDDESPSWEAFNVGALPTLYLIDREGRIVQRWIGLVDLAAVRAAVDREIGAQSK